MDPQTAGTLGAWLGGGIGVLGGLVGTWFSIRNTQSPRERAFVIKASLICWALVIAFVASLLLIPTWHRHLLWIPYSLLLVWGIRRWNKMQLRIQNEDAGKTSL